MSGVACEIYVYSACCYSISLVVALKNKRRITKPLWFCAFNHPFTGLVNIHNNTTVTKEGVTKLLKGLNPSKALGPDELHHRVLKE